MSGMVMSPRERNRTGTKHRVGPGGRRCACCDVAPKDNRRARRASKRAERQRWRQLGDL